MKNFSGNRWAENYKKLVENLLKILQDIGNNISIKVHFLGRHLHKFPDNCGDVSDKQGEGFHQNIKIIEDCHQRRWDKRMMVDYYWTIKKNLNNIELDRQSKKKKN